MRAKKAKRLRRQAEKVTVGLPAINYRMVKVFNPKGEEYTDRGMVILDRCTRAVHRALKASVYL